MSVSKDLGYILERLARPPFLVQIDAGLSDAEFDEIETRYAIVFPPDLRALLSIGLPVGDTPSPPLGVIRAGLGFVEWRNGDKAKVRERLAWPLESALFDVREAAFWFRTWPARPDSLDAAVEIATRELSVGAPLIPIYSHRYIPSAPSEAGNPILSVYQTDVIHYGSDLEDYFENEFFDKENRFHRSGGHVARSPRDVPFWGDLYEING